MAPRNTVVGFAEELATEAGGKLRATIRLQRTASKACASFAKQFCVAAELRRYEF